MRTADCRNRRRYPLLISFSGIDGSGKSTQIERATEELDRNGYHVARFAFWDDVVVLSRFREGVTHKVFKSEKGIGAPGKPVRRRDKNVRAWYLSLMRAALYFLDALHLRLVVHRGRRFGAHAIIFDRYIYDEIANLPMANTIARAYSHLLASVAPRPHVAYVVDANPEAACARKPEYPLDFTQRCREIYLQLAAMLGLTVVPASTVDGAHQFVMQKLSQQVSLPSVASPGSSASERLQIPA
jgi:thymidylate kinase